MKISHKFISHKFISMYSYFYSSRIVHSIWKFIEVLRKEQGLTEIKHAFYLSGRNPAKRKCYTDNEKALRNLIDSYLSRPKLDFLKGIAYRFGFCS